MASKDLVSRNTTDLVRQGDPCEAYKKSCPECGFVYKGTYEDDRVCPMCHAERPRCQRTVCKEARAAGHMLCYAHWRMKYPELKGIVDVAESRRIPFIEESIRQFGDNNAPDLSPEIIQLREMIQRSYEGNTLNAAEYGRLINSLATVSETNKRIQEKNRDIEKAVQKIVDEKRKDDAVYYMAYMLLLILGQFGWNSDEAKFIKSRLLYLNTPWFREIIKAAEDIRDNEIVEFAEDEVDNTIDEDTG
jgi:hypothetical protein